jgi:tetratricopeptide (TPR) repeat protein
MSTRSRRAIVGIAAALLLVAAALMAVYLGNRRDVTTSSAAAYDAYQKGIENDRRFYKKEAQVDYARALSLDPNFAMAMLRLARLSNEEQARALVERASRLRGRLNEHERLWVDFASASLKRNLEERLRIARAVHERYPGDIDATMQLCEHEMSQGHTEEALRIYTDLLAQDPNNASIYNFIGYYNAYRGDYDKAIESLRKYQFMAPDQANPYDSLGEVQANSGHYDEAIANLNKALSLKPDFFESFNHLGIAYEGKGDFPRAIRFYETASREALTDGSRVELLGYALRTALIARDPAAAREVAGRIEQLPKGRSADFLRSYKDVALDLVDGRPADAERRLTELKPRLLADYGKEAKGSERKPHLSGWNALMAVAKARQGKTDEAIALWELNVNPPVPWADFEGRRAVYEARAHLAELLARKGDLDRAEKLLAENHKWNPNWAPSRPSELVVEQARREKVLAASAGTATSR